MMDASIRSVDEGADSGDEFDPLGELLQAWRRRRKTDTFAAEGYRLDPTPYPGLKSFAPSDAGVFFGRKGEERILAARLEKHNVLAVLGGSGSGKSSLVRAGLLPHLTSLGKIPDRTGRWYVAEMQPGTDPTGAMVHAIWGHVCIPRRLQKFGSDALARAFAGLPSEGSAELAHEAVLRTSVTERTAASPGADKDPEQDEIYLRKLIRLLVDREGVLSVDGLFRFADDVLQVLDDRVSRGLQAGPANLMVLIDQFEELFRPEIDNNGRDGIIALLKAVQKRGAMRPRPGLFLAVTMRSEELHRCSEHEGLSGVIIDSAVQLELISSDKEVTATIVEPARRVFESWGIPYAKTGKEAETAPFEAPLVASLKEQARQLRESLDHKPDSLPLLQHALQSIWDNALARWRRRLQAGDSGFQPTIRLNDFVTRDADSPLRRCLNARAEEAREEALKVLVRLGRSHELSEENASNLIDVAFVSLARLDDSNRWVRQFASVAEVAEASGLFKRFAGVGEAGVIGKIAAIMSDLRAALFGQVETKGRPVSASDAAVVGKDKDDPSQTPKDEDQRFRLALEAFRRARSALYESGWRKVVVNWMSKLLAKSGVTNSLVRILARKEAQARASDDVRRKLAGRKKQLITNALEMFRRAGYVSSRGGRYDVSHESFIRSWDHYRRILDRAQSVRSSLITLDDTYFRQSGHVAPAEDEPAAMPSEAGARSRSWGARMKQTCIGAYDRATAPLRRIAAMRPIAIVLRCLRWTARQLANFFKLITFQKAKKADAALKFGIKTDLERIYRPPHLFSEYWITWQLIDYWRRKSKVRALIGGIATERSARPTAEEWKRALARSRDLRNLLHSADWWRYGRFRFAFIWLAVAGGVLSMFILTGATGRLREVIDIQTLISDQSASRLQEPKYADFDLHQAVTAAASFNRDVIDKASWLRPGLQPAYDKFFYQLDIITRQALKPLRSHASTVPASRVGTEAKCMIHREQGDNQSKTPAQTDRLPDNRVETVVADSLRGLAMLPTGPVFYYRKLSDTQITPASGPLPFLQESGLACLDSSATALLFWNQKALPIVISLTWVPTGSGWVVVFDLLETPRSALAELRYQAFADPPAWLSHDFSKRILSFDTSQTRGFHLDLAGLPAAKDIPAHWYLSFPRGVNHAEPRGKVTIPTNMSECLGDPSLDGRVCTVKDLKLGGDRLFVFDRTIVQQPAAADLRAESDRCTTLCFQQLRLYAAGQHGEPVLRFQKLHYSAPIIWAMIVGEDVILIDRTGQMWKYVLGWGELRETIQANDLSGNLKLFAERQKLGATHEDFQGENRNKYLSPICRQANCDRRSTEEVGLFDWMLDWAKEKLHLTTPAAIGTPAPAPPSG